jgi:hypothetical protein
MDAQNFETSADFLAIIDFKKFPLSLILILREIEFVFTSCFSHHRALRERLNKYHEVIIVEERICGTSR